MNQSLQIIDASIQMRQEAAETIAAVLPLMPEISELQFREEMANRWGNSPKLHASGWYDPPPFGISALFSAERVYDRLAFDTLRNEAYWPKQEFSLRKESVGLMYVSPVHRATGAVGDFGLTVYRGELEHVRGYFVTVMKTLEQISKTVEAGMSLHELHAKSQALLQAVELISARAHTLTDPKGLHLGYVIPWSFEEPTAEEVAVIIGNDFDKLKNLIAKKRLFINEGQNFSIPQTTALVCELHVKHAVDPSLPWMLCNIFVVFRDGKKQIYANFKPIFERLGINRYINSLYG